MKEKVGDDRAMFTDRYLLNFASGLKNTNELFSLLSVYGKYLATFRDALIHRMNTMSTLTYDDRIIDRLYFQSSDENQNDRIVLSAYVNNVYRSNGDLPETPSMYTAVFMACYTFAHWPLPQSIAWLERGDRYKPHFAKLMMELLNMNDAFYIKEENILNALKVVPKIESLLSGNSELTTQTIQQMQDTAMNQEKKNAIRVAVLRLRDLLLNRDVHLGDFLTQYRACVKEDTRTQTLLSVENYQPYKSYLSEELYGYTVIVLGSSAKYAETDPHRFTIYFSEIVHTISTEVTNMKPNYKIYQLMFNQILRTILTLGDITDAQYVHAKGVIDSLPYQGAIDFYENAQTAPTEEEDESDADRPVETPVVINATPGMEAVNRSSNKIQQGSERIYKSWKKFQRHKDIVVSQISKMTNAAGRAFIGDVKKEVIAGKDFTPMGILQKALGTAALFSFGPIKGLTALVVRTAIRRSTSKAERKKVIIELQREIDIVDEKIQDARGDGNRKAKYAMMRTKAELQTALERIEYGLEADTNAKVSANKTIDKVRGY